MENPRLELAEQFVLNTRKNLFVTGRAGTGKTTFLRKVLKSTKKNHMVVAPTGVAAINAGGITIHSLFQLPLTGFTPDSAPADFNIVTNRSGLGRHLRYNGDKLKLFRSLDLLVIDEISMVRADLLDAIDFALQRVRANSNPFGGVQLLVIGDLFQLAPVVKNNQWDILRQYYLSPYFFDALSWKKSSPVTIELTKIYRQTDQDFIDILNRMRNGKSIPEDLERLNQNYKPDFQPEGEKYITLTTHNRKADKINAEKMAALSAKSFTYKAMVVDTFNENAYPAEFQLTLKKGAQVMFIRNDAEGRYYNGKLAEVISTSRDVVEVRMESGEQLIVEQVTWNNTKYELDKETNEIKEETLGSFSQYPLRLAWAITVHKSQGLTFERMIVDLGDSFASGQAYVALSRCISLDGLVLLSKMRLQNVMVNDKIVTYHDYAPAEDQLSAILETAKVRFASEELQNTFSFELLEFACKEWQEEIGLRKIPNPEETEALAREMVHDLNGLKQVAKNFKRQLHFLLAQYPAEQQIEPIRERVEKAVIYFTDKFHEQLCMPIYEHIESLAYKAKVKKYLLLPLELQQTIWVQMEKFYQVSFMGVPLFTKEVKYKREHLQPTKTSNTKKKRKKGATYDDTLALLKAGKNAEEIAEIRSLAVSTIHGHFAKLVESKSISISEVMPTERVEKIAFYLIKHPDDTLAEVRNKVSIEATFNELRIVRAHVLLQNE